MTDQIRGEDKYMVIPIRFVTVCLTILRCIVIAPDSYLVGTTSRLGVFGFTGEVTDGLESLEILLIPCLPNTNPPKLRDSTEVVTTAQPGQLQVSLIVWFVIGGRNRSGVRVVSSPGAFFHRSRLPGRTFSTD